MGAATKRTPSTARGRVPRAASRRAAPRRGRGRRAPSPTRAPPAPQESRMPQIAPPRQILGKASAVVVQVVAPRRHVRARSRARPDPTFRRRARGPPPENPWRALPGAGTRTSPRRCRSARRGEGRRRSHRGVDLRAPRATGVGRAGGATPRFHGRTAGDPQDSAAAGLPRRHGPYRAPPSPRAVAGAAPRRARAPRPRKLGCSRPTRGASPVRRSAAASARRDPTPDLPRGRCGCRGYGSRSACAPRDASRRPDRRGSRPRIRGDRSCGSPSLRRHC